MSRKTTLTKEDNMAYNSGPIRTLPGSVYVTPPGYCMCDECDTQKAEYRLQGETDSFGAEFSDLCGACFEKALKRIAQQPMAGRCDYCKKDAPLLKPTRDPEESFCGPVYYVCEPCRAKQQARLAREDEEYRNRYRIDSDSDYDYID